MFFLAEKAECSSIRSPTNGSVDFTMNGTRAQFACNPGFFLKGNATITCINGRWNAWPPVCSKIKLPVINTDTRKSD